MTLFLLLLKSSLRYVHSITPLCHSIFYSNITLLFSVCYHLWTKHRAREKRGYKKGHFGDPQKVSTQSKDDGQYTPFFPFFFPSFPPSSLPPYPFLPSPLAFQWAELVPVNSHAQRLKFWWPWEICLWLKPHRHFSGQLKDVWIATSMLFYTGNQAIFVLLWF